ncbi:hypothetical protein H2248_007281 [Termitomyces sp. 'cryptogamus']|nr:hypothetical protein H2248_007281 [Termitomyces sp. 'cryptogamus']
MALLSTFGILAGIGSLIVSTSAAIEARSDGINANLSSAQEHLNNARMLLVANRLFLSEEEYDESSVQSQVLSDELSRLKEQYLTYSRKPFFNSNRFKVLADTVKGKQWDCNNFHNETLMLSALAAERKVAHNKLEAQRILQHQTVTDKIQVLYIQAIASLQDIVGDTRQGRS